MTQEVQPLTWSKRTNIEEHQQFFSKINEIIGNLAPTVDEAEQAIAQATAAIASANDAVATANAASAAASAAASQAQTAATTAAGYDGRLTAAEGDIDSLQGRMGTAEAKNAQQDTAIAALQNADGQNIKINNVNQYAVGLTGNQIVTGRKDMLSPINGGYMLFKSQLNVFSEGEFVRIFRGVSFGQTHLMIYGTQANNGLGLIDILAGGSDNYDRSVMIGSYGYISESKIVVVQVNNHTEVWMKRTNRVGFISVIVTYALTAFETTDIVQGTGLTSPPVIGGTDPITGETITGVKELN